MVEEGERAAVLCEQLRVALSLVGASPAWERLRGAMAAAPVTPPKTAGRCYLNCHNRVTRCFYGKYGWGGGPVPLFAPPLGAEYPPQ